MPPPVSNARSRSRMIIFFFFKVTCRINFSSPSAKPSLPPFFSSVGTADCAPSSSALFFNADVSSVLLLVPNAGVSFSSSTMTKSSSFLSLVPPFSPWPAIALLSVIVFEDVLNPAILFRCMSSSFRFFSRSSISFLRLLASSFVMNSIPTTNKNFASRVVAFATPSPDRYGNFSCLYLQPSFFILHDSFVATTISSIRFSSKVTETCSETILKPERSISQSLYFTPSFSPSIGSIFIVGRYDRRNSTEASLISFKNASRASLSS
mmetsp:Transcript_31866/g.77650  ORF Transcript_31866/g.77650 Transcript_31866/m.77650 type:complete len:265 (+) Transcript_31866:430-1224(+)